MSALRLLALSYLASASVFVVTATLVAHPGLARSVAGGAQDVAAMVEDIWQPREEENSAVARLILAPPAVERPLARADIVPPPPRAVEAPQLAESDAPATVTILPDLPALSDPPAPSQAPTLDIDVARNDAMQAAPAFRIPEPPPWSAGESRSNNKPWSAGESRSDNKMDSDAPVTDRATAASLRLRGGLTPEMQQNFDLFLYVSKADRGPLAQRLYVFRKSANGDLKLAYDWAASTGREKSEISPAGHRAFTATPRGYYELDPARMYRSYHSVSWDQDMPNAMFFNWERAGLQTGLAIHAASGDDVFKLGSRASAGCVHLAPENAATLFNLIRGHYRGAVPRFAYNYETQTMSNKGVFMHDRSGNLKMADGYRVLVMIEDYGGENVVAALF